MLNNMLNLSFWFDRYPEPFTPLFFWILLSIFIAAVVFGIISSILISKNKKDKLKKMVWSKCAGWAYALGIAGLLLVFLKQQQAPYLGMRVLTTLWLLISLVWLIFILKFLFIKVPKLKKEQQEKAEFEKYIP